MHVTALMLKNGIIILLTLILPGCTNLLFYPYKQHVRSPETLGLHYQDVTVTTADHINIHGWFLSAQGKINGVTH